MPLEIILKKAIEKFHLHVKYKMSEIGRFTNLKNNYEYQFKMNKLI